MAIRKNQSVHFKNVPKLLYGTVTHIVDEGATDPSVIVQPEPVRVHSSDLESAEIEESSTSKIAHAVSGRLAHIPAQWAADPDNPHLRTEMLELLREAGLLKKI